MSKKKEKKKIPSALTPLSFLYWFCSSGENIYLHREHYVVRWDVKMTAFFFLNNRPSSAFFFIFYNCFCPFFFLPSLSLALESSAEPKVLTNSILFCKRRAGWGRCMQTMSPSSLLLLWRNSQSYTLLYQFHPHSAKSKHWFMSSKVAKSLTERKVGLLTKNMLSLVISRKPHRLCPIFFLRK